MFKLKYLKKKKKSNSTINMVSSISFTDFEGDVLIIKAE